VIPPTEWTTLAPREVIRRHQVADIHCAVFVPLYWPGHGPAIVALVPERIMLGPGDDEITEPHNESLDRWLCRVCEKVRHAHAGVIFSCDTPEQTEDIVKAVTPLLPNYERIAIERLSDSGRSNLS
jgi:hypothetical protein